MELSCNSAPKVLEGYLADNINFEQFIIPTDKNLFQSIWNKIEKYSYLIKIYKIVEERYHHQDPHLKSRIFLNECEKFNLTLPKNVINLLASQAIRLGEQNKFLPEPDRQNKFDRTSIIKYKSGIQSLNLMINKLKMNQEENIANLKELDQSTYDILEKEYRRLKATFDNNNFNKISNNYFIEK